MHCKSGIYKILNTANGKFYLGSAVYFYDRWSNHKYYLRRNKHKNKYLQSAWNKYGEDAFEFQIIEYVLPENLLKAEQYWLDQTNCCDRKIGYNLYNLAGSPIGTKWTEERKIKQSERMKKFRHTEESKFKMKGRIKTKEEIEKASAAKRGKPRSKETKEKIRLANSDKTRNQKLDVWPHGSKCLCKDCKLIRNKYLYLQRNNRLDLWYV